MKREALYDPLGVMALQLPEGARFVAYDRRESRARPNRWPRGSSPPVASDAARALVRLLQDRGQLFSSCCCACDWVAGRH
jgi:hypothetical protein